MKKLLMRVAVVLFVISVPFAAASIKFDEERDWASTLSEKLFDSASGRYPDYYAGAYISNVLDTYEYFMDNPEAFAGIYINNEQTKYIVMLTRQADAGKVKADLAERTSGRTDYEVAVTDHVSYSELNRIMGQISENHARLTKEQNELCPMAAWGVDIMEGVVDVNIVKLDAQKEALFKQWVIDSPHVKLKSIDETIKLD